MKPWKHICVKSCWFAKHEKCTCHCKKQNHGKGFQKRLDDRKEEEKQQPDGKAIEESRF